MHFLRFIHILRAIAVAATREEVLKGEEAAETAEEAAKEAAVAAA